MTQVVGLHLLASPSVTPSGTSTRRSSSLLLRVCTPANLSSVVRRLISWWAMFFRLDPSLKELWFVMLSTMLVIVGFLLELLGIMLLSSVTTLIMTLPGSSCHLVPKRLSLVDAVL
uniref:Uncharacterized protein n=1 Tax=Opuntia streptacantha TaxID=393608 RepID=A0A7C9DBL0_OPUST